MGGSGAKVVVVGLFAVGVGLALPVHAGPVVRQWAGVLSPLVKLRPGQVPSDAASSIRWRAARGECEAAQVAVAPGKQDVALTAPALSGSGKQPALPLALSRVHYVQVRTPSNSEGAPGLWPDPLLPLPGPSAKLGDAGREEPLVVWTEVCVPAAQPPGRYEGALTLTAKGTPPLTLPVTLEVLPFTLPATSSLPNTFGISLYSVAKGHGLKPESDGARELLHAYARMALEHRISLHGMFIDAPPASRRDGGLRWDFSGYDREMARYFDGSALPSGARFTAEKLRDTADAKTAEERAAYVKAWREHFRTRGYSVPLFFYAKDEPKPDDYPLVLDQAAAVHRAGGVPVLVTSALEKRLLPATDILTPVLNCFFQRRGPSTCAAVRDVPSLRQTLGKGKQVWWYQSCMSHGCEGGPVTDRALEEAYSGWASYMVDHPAPLNRAMGSLAFLSGVDGELYFDTVHAYNEKDPWEDVFLFGGNGDGTLFYPGTPKRLSGPGHLPVASIRLKHIRDGLEDYEYLTLLAKKGQREAARRWARMLTPRGYDIRRDLATWEKVRGEMGSKLAQLEGGSEYGGGGGVRR